MKTIFKRFILALVALIATTGVWADELTVYDGTATNSYVPVYGLYADAYLKCEMVMPAADLAEMAGSEITAMTFYLSSPATDTWGSTFQVFMKETDGTSLSAFTGTAGATTVYEGTLDGTRSTMTINFTTPFEYQGGNLLIGVYNLTEGSWKSCTFSGESVSGASVQGYSYSSLDVINAQQRDFLPKTTFTYSPPRSITGTCDHGTMTFTVDGVEATEAKPGQKVTVIIKSEGNWYTDNVTVRPYDDNWSGAQSRSAEPQAIPFQTIPTTRSGNTWTFTMPNNNVEVRATSSLHVPLTVTARSYEVGVGEAAPRFTVTYDGLTGGDTPADLDKLLTFSCDYTKGSPEGTYTITPSGLTSPKYDVTYVPGTLTVEQRTYVAKDGVVYSVGSRSASVIGIVGSALPTWNKTGKKITIVDRIAAEDGGVAVPVVAFASGWTDAGWYQNGTYTALPGTVEQAVTDPVTGLTTYTTSQAAGSTSYTGYQTSNASDIKAPVYMLIRASEMTEISRADVDEFTVQQFTLGESCGILAIPDYLFAPMKEITSEANQNQINANNSEIESLQTTLGALQATQSANADQISFWTNVIAERERNIEVAKTTQWWKTQEGELQQLKDQKTAYENLAAIIKQLYTVWSDASTTVIRAIEAGSKAGLTDAQKTIYDNIVAAMVAANISPKVGGGYNVPNLPDVNEQIETLENTTIPAKEEFMNSEPVFLKEGAQAQSQQNPKYSMNDLKNLLQGARDELAKVDKSDRIKEVSDRIKELQNENKGLKGDLSVLDEDGKNETLQQVNLYGQQLETVGEGAFANCVNAKFGFKDAKFDAALKLIRQKAFLNTLLDNVDLSDAKDENLDVQWNAFYGTPLKTLKLKGIQSTIIGPEHVMCYVQGLKKVGKGYTYTDGCGYEYKTLENTNTNNTLTTVTLPETGAYTFVHASTFEDCIALPSIEIPAQVTKIDDKAFENCIALSAVTFAGDQVAHIGEAAFFRTAVPAFDFSSQFKLAEIEDLAFAANCALETVNLPADKDKYSYEQAPLKALYANTFRNSGNLKTVTFNGNMFYLAEGLFDSNRLEDLDLSKTKVLVLNDLFHAGQNHPLRDENGNIQYQKDDAGNFVLDSDNKPMAIYTDPVNTTLKSVTLPEGLLAINNFALAGLQCPDFQDDLVIPGSVVFTGVGAFRNSSFVKNIKFPGTTQQYFERGTFEQCLNLQTVELFVEEALYTPSQTFTVTTASRAGFTAALSSAYNRLVSGEGGYGSLIVDGQAPAVIVPVDNIMGDPLNIDPFLEALKRYNVPFRYYNAIYGDPNRISGDNQFGQWMSTLGGDGWYGSDNEWNSDIFIGSVWGFDDEWFDGRPGHPKATVYVTPNDVLQLRADGYEEVYSVLAPYPTKIQLTNVGAYSYGIINKTHGVWIPYKTEDGTPVVVYSAYQDGNNVILHPAKIKNGYYKVAGYDPGAEFGSYAQGFYWVPDNADWSRSEQQAKAADRASAAVIRVPGNVTEIAYIAQHSRSTHTIPAGMASYEEVHIAPRFQSTLDNENELQILDEDVYPATNMNWYKFGVYENEVNFWYVSSGRLAAGNVAFQGVGVNGLTRLNAVFVEPNEATAVLGIKEYRDMMQNGTIYNLQGVKVTAPVKGNMYIKDGIKYIQK